MNKSAIAVVLTLGLIAAPLAHAKKRSDLVYVDSYSGRTDIPVPVTVVSPVISGEHAGTDVEVTFVVDTTGKPVGITTSKPADHELTTRITRAVAQWRFTPARGSMGEPVARRVVLPVRIVDRSSGGYAIR